MPVGPGYVAVIDHIQNGEIGNEDLFQRTSLQFEQRTDALKAFVEDELEVELDAVSAKADQNEADIDLLEADTTPADLVTHVADTTQHTDFADNIEAKTGVDTTKVISPSTLAATSRDILAHAYDAIVGDPTIANGGAGVTHSSIASALASASAGWRILITNDQFITATLNIILPNIEIEFRRGASIKNGATVVEAFKVTVDGSATGNDFYLNKARIEGFTTAIQIGNIGIGDQPARTVLRDTRFKSNTATVVDEGLYTSDTGSITEV